MLDAVVVGAGPNGLAAAVILARAGLAVEVFEKNSAFGGGARSSELTLPGFIHDVGAAVHPMAFASPFFRAFELRKRVEFLTPDVSYVHPLEGSRAAVAYRDLDKTADGLGVDGRAWTQLFAPLVANIDAVADLTGSGLLRWPRNIRTSARFGLRVLEQGSAAWGARFREGDAPALLSGVEAHASGRMPSFSSAGVGLALAAHGHARGWPIPVGGSGAIMSALADDFTAHGGVIHLNESVKDLRDLPASTAVVCDVSARSLATIAGGLLPPRYIRALHAFKYGNGVAKVDFALSGPVPWLNDEAKRAVTLHLGGSRESIAASEEEITTGAHSSNPYVLVAQPSVLDDSRAPSGKHTLWAYIHVPAGSTVDPTEVITRQIERWAPGFRDVALASAPMSATDLEAVDPNFIGGDISSGALSLRQLVARPVLSPTPWRTPARGIYLASSSTPPGTGVHGLSGYHAAGTLLRDLFGQTDMPDLSMGM